MFCAMDSSLAPIIADIVMFVLDEDVLGAIYFYVPFYYRYVHDSLIPISKHNIDEVTIEIPQKECINFHEAILSIEKD